ncbi:MAG: transglutaminase domain-containing protein [Anaerolineales bacterium]|nr:transglutaminase domain-containing protein [Anaerolineales bacterium]
MEKSRTRWWDIPSAIFLFLIILFSAWRLQATDWAEGLKHVRNVALLGLVIGLALGQSAFRKRSVIFLSIGYMLVVFIWQWFGYIEFSEEEAYLGDRLLILAGRLLTGLSEFAAGRPVKDPLFFLALLFIPYWFTALVSGYQLTRHANALAAALPSGVLMFFIYQNHYTTRDYTWLFGAYLLAALLLLGRIKYLADRIKWKDQRVQVPPESSMDINNAIMACAAVLILVVWLVPYTVPYNTNARRAWQKVSANWFSENEQIDNMFAAVKKDKVPSSDFYRNELALGTRASQSESIAFLVYAPAAAQDFPRLYWRGRVYDRFEEGRWQTSDVENKKYVPQDGDFKIPDTGQRFNLNFSYSVYIKGQTILYSAAQPVWTSHPASIAHSVIPGETDREELMDIVALQASPYLEAGETYHTNALLANPTIPDLQEAGQEYPAWVTEKYLQLPADFSPRIQALAFDITAEFDNPYDQAAAITSYLRSEIEYTPVVSFPDETEDPLEYFLFVSKQGFCNYYASAEVLMLRSVGIPARLAVGFAQGEPNLQSSFYTVRERDAHAWPEVYFPGYGWIEFEPTGNQEPVDRPSDREEKPSNEGLINNPVDSEALAQQEPQFIPPVERDVTGILPRAQLVPLGIFGGVVLLFVAAFFIKRRYAPNMQTALILKNVVERNGWETPVWLNRWTLWANLNPIQKYFHSINVSLRWMKAQQALHVTPAERAGILQELLPTASVSIETLLAEYQSALFSKHEGNVQSARSAAWNILYQTIYARLKFFILGYN